MRTPALHPDPSVARALVAWAAAVGVLAASGGAVGAAAQQGRHLGSPADAPCPTRVLSRIEIRNHSLFAREDIEGRRFAWALGLANWVHVRTRARFLRDEMLVEEGSCFDEAAVTESARLIRDLDFIARVEAVPRQLPDSTWAVRLETWDEWTTQFGIDFDVESRLQFMGFFVREKNFLGRGLQLAFRYRHFRERDDRNLTLSTGRFLGTRANASVAAGTTRTGSFFRQEISYPFVAEAGRFSLETRLQREDLEHSFLTGDHSSISHVLLPLTEFGGHVRVARRSGVPGALSVWGGELAWMDREVSRPVRQVVRDDFDAALSAHDSLASRLAGQDAPHSYVRAGATAGIRRLRFTTGKGLDRVSGVQNVALGTELLLTVGHSLATWGPSGAYGYARVEGFAGAQERPFLTVHTLRGEARRLDDASPGSSRWRELALFGSSLVYVQPGPGTVNTLVTGVRYNLRGNMDRPFQEALGGDEWVRSYREDEVPVGSKVVAFAEHRLNLPLFRPVMDLGLTVFGDVGRGWSSDVPFGVDTGWRKAMGVGLRLGFPAGTGSVARVELSWPVGGPEPDRAPLFRTYWSVSPTSR